LTVFQNQVGGLEEIAVKVTSNAAAFDIVDGTEEAWYVPWLQINENAGGAPSLTLDLYDGTTAYYLGAGGVVYKTKALTAGQSVTFSEGIVVPKGWKLRATSNNAVGQMEAVGTKVRRVG
jgi:hypothetical protein